MAVHYANIGLVHVDASGNIISGTDYTISQRLTSNSEMRVLPDASIASSAGYPTIKAYLEAEETAGFRLGVINQTMIITYDALP